MVIWYVNPTNNDGNYEMTIINSCFQLLTTTLLCIRCDAIGPASVNPQMVWPWKLQSSHLDSSNIFQKVLSHSPVSWSTGWGWEDLVRAVGPGNFYFWAEMVVLVRMQRCEGQESFFLATDGHGEKSIPLNKYKLQYKISDKITRVYKCVQLRSNREQSDKDQNQPAVLFRCPNCAVHCSSIFSSASEYVPLCSIHIWFKMMNNQFVHTTCVYSSNISTFSLSTISPRSPSCHGWNSGPYATQLLILLLDPQGHLRVGSHGITTASTTTPSSSPSIPRYPEPSACIIRRGMSQSLHRDSTVSSSSRGREVLLNKGPQASLSCRTERKGRHVEICPVHGKQWSKNILQDCWISESRWWLNSTWEGLLVSDRMSVMKTCRLPRWHKTDSHFLLELLAWIITMVN